MAESSTSILPSDQRRPHGVIQLGRRTTVDDLDAITDEDGLTAELLGGELYVQPQPCVWHRNVQGRLISKLIGPFNGDPDGPGGWVFLIEPELRIEGEVLVPDLAAWREERAPEIDGTVSIPVAPDWVCEVLSPSTAARDRSVKMQKYAEWGVPFIWIADPEHRTLEAYQLTDGKWLQLDVLHGETGVELDPFAAAPFPLEVLWR